MIASFWRALTEGLSAEQSDDEFNAALAGDDRQHLRGLDRRIGLRGRGTDCCSLCRRA